MSGQARKALAWDQPCAHLTRSNRRLVASCLRHGLLSSTRGTGSSFNGCLKEEQHNGHGLLPPMPWPSSFEFPPLSARLVAPTACAHSGASALGLCFVYENLQHALRLMELDFYMIEGALGLVHYRRYLVQLREHVIVGVNVRLL